MEYFKKIFKYSKPFKKYIFLNIFFNILYALFSALSFLSLMPMLEVLFGENKKSYNKPEFDGIDGFGNNLEGWLNYQVSSFSGRRPTESTNFCNRINNNIIFSKEFF